MRCEVLAHIVEVTDARPRGEGRWMGHCVAHGSQKHRDLSIRDTGDRILLHDFAGCPLDNILAALGLRISDLFDDAPLPHASHRVPKPKKPTRLQLAFQAELTALDHRVKADWIFRAAAKLDAVLLTDNDRNRALDALAVAYRATEEAERFELRADALRWQYFTERMDREQSRRIA